MARKHSLNHKMLQDADISVDQTSAKTNVESLDKASILVNWQGVAPVGTITIQVSNSTDNEFNQNSEVWIPLEFGSPIEVNGNVGNHVIQITELPFRYIRFVYSSTAGSGILTAHLQATSVGA